MEHTTRKTKKIQHEHTKISREKHKAEQKT
jgi:hypothetical protein